MMNIDLIVEFDDSAENQEDTYLRALATERMTRFDPTTLITQAQVDAEFGFTENK